MAQESATCYVLSSLSGHSAIFSNLNPSRDISARPDHISIMTLFKATNSHQLAIVIVPVIMVSLATVCVVLRFRARRLLKQAAMFDDWFCLIALVCLWFISFLVISPSPEYPPLTGQQILTWIFQGINMAAVFAGGAGLPIATVIEIDPSAVEVYLKVS